MDQEMDSATESVATKSAEQIDFRQIDDFIAAPAQNRFNRKQAEALYLLRGNRRWHGQFLPVYKNFDQGWAVMLQGLGNHRSNLSGCFRSQSHQPGAFPHFSNILTLT